MSQLFASGGQSIGVSASASVLPINIQDWFPLGWAGWISLLPKDSQESSPIPQFKSINYSVLSFLYSPTLTSIHTYYTYMHAYIHTYIHTHIHPSIHTYIHTYIHTHIHPYIHPYTQHTTKALTTWTFVGKVMSLLLNMLSRLVITFLSRSKRLLITWLQSPLQ